MEEWIAEAVGKMHIHKIRQRDVADKLGYTREYIGMILIGLKSPPGIGEKILSAIDEIIAERQKN